MHDKQDFWRLINNESFEETTRTPTLDEVVDEEWKKLFVPDDEELLSLGVSEKSGYVQVTEAERENHFWILGTTGEGKSKFLEYLIRHDIDRLMADRHLPKNERRSCSLCFIDPTPQGINAQNILNYCAQIGFKKVFLVDAYQIGQVGRVPPINPLNYNEKYIETSVDYLEDAFRILFGVDDLSDTSNIATYLHGILMLLHFAGMSLSDLLWFSVAENEEYEAKREVIYRIVRGRIEKKKISENYHEILEKHIEEISFAFSRYSTWAKEIGSTAKRLNQLVNNTALRNIFGHRRGVNFEKLVSEGWVILVNASTGEGLGTLQSRLLATVVINQIIFTIERIRRYGFNKPYYIYIDEAQKYATDKLYEILDTKRNTKIRLVLSNHFPEQFPTRVRNSVKNQTKTKIAFYVEGRDERESVARELYGGKIKGDDIEYALRQQQKRQAVMKTGKTGSVIAKTHEVVNAKPNVNFLADLLETGNYESTQEALKDINERFNSTVSKNTESTESRKTSDRKTDSKTSVFERVRGRHKESSVSAGNEKLEDAGKEAGTDKTKTLWDV